VTDQNQNNEDARIQALFQDLSRPLPDNGFSEQVMVRIARRARRRNAVLFTAAIIGGAVSLWPLSKLATAFVNGLLLTATRWTDPTWLLQNQLMIIAIALVGLAPFAIRWLED